MTRASRASPASATRIARPVRALNPRATRLMDPLLQVILRGCDGHGRAWARSQVWPRDAELSAYERVTPDLYCARCAAYRRGARCFTPTPRDRRSRPDRSL